MCMLSSVISLSTEYNSDIRKIIIILFRALPTVIHYAYILVKTISRGKHITRALNMTDGHEKKKHFIFHN